MPAPAPADRLDALDGLRGVLALWVAVTHAVCWCGFADAGIDAGAPGRFAWAWHELVYARPAVDVFIVLSGFVIAKLLTGRPTRFGPYLARRFWRIYPTYAVCLAIGVLTAGLTPFVLATAAWGQSAYFEWTRFASECERAAPLTHLAWHVSLLHGIVGRDALPCATATFLTPAWSISLEWQFYLVAPAILRLSGRPLGAAVLVAVAALGARFCLPWANPHLAFLPAKLGLFLVGIGSARLDAACRGRPGRLAMILIGAAAICVVAGYHPIAMAIWAGVLTACRVDRSGWRSVRNILESGPARSLGRVSYPLYLVHWPMIIAMLWVLLKLRPGATPVEALAVLLVVGVPLMLAAAGVLHRTVEAPMMMRRRVNPSVPSAFSRWPRTRAVR